MRLLRPSLPLVDVAEQEQRLRLGPRCGRARPLLRHLEQLVCRLLQLAEHHRHVRPVQTQPTAQVGVLIVQQVERARVVAVRLAQALAALGAAGRVREHGCGFPRPAARWGFA